MTSAPTSSSTGYLRSSLYANLTSVEWRTQKLLTLGSRIAFVAYLLGAGMAYTYEVSELSSNRLVMRTNEGPVPMETSSTWERVEEGRTQIRENPVGIPRLRSVKVPPFMKMAIRRANKTDLVLLKGRVRVERHPCEALCVTGQTGEVEIRFVSELCHMPAETLGQHRHTGTR